jgi:hypothetical protein
MNPHRNVPEPAVVKKTTNPKVGFRVGLFIRADSQDQIRAGTRQGKKFLVLNSISLAEHSILAFERLKKIVTEGEDLELLKNMVKAKRLRLPVSVRVSNQFETVYLEACRKELSLRREGKSERPQDRKA